MHYDPIMCMMVEDSVKINYGLDDPEKNAGYEMKKEGRYYKIYKNGKLVAMKSPEEEARQAAASHRPENDSNIVNKVIRNCDSMYSDIKEVYNILAEALRNSSNSDKMVQLVSKAQGKILELAAKSK